MKIVFTASALEITDALHTDMESGNYTNPYGERTSEYHTFVRDETDNSISMQSTEERDGLSPDEYFYTVHLIDEITGKDCEIFNSNEQTKESLLLLVTDIVKNTLSDVIKL